MAGTYTRFVNDQQRRQNQLFTGAVASDSLGNTFGAAGDAMLSQMDAETPGWLAGIAYGLRGASRTAGQMGNLARARIGQSMSLQSEFTPAALSERELDDYTAQARRRRGITGASALGNAFAPVRVFRGVMAGLDALGQLKLARGLAQMRSGQ